MQQKSTAKIMTLIKWIRLRKSTHEDAAVAALPSFVIPSRTAITGLMIVGHDARYINSCMMLAAKNGVGLACRHF
jgi:hypothetical protein